MREDSILTAAEVAAELRCSKAHVYHLIRGEVEGVPPLPAICLGRHRLVRRSSLETWKAAVETKSAGATLIPARPKSAPLDA